VFYFFLVVLFCVSAVNGPMIVFNMFFFFFLFVFVGFFFFVFFGMGPSVFFSLFLYVSYILFLVVLPVTDIDFSFSLSPSGRYQPVFTCLILSFRFSCTGTGFIILALLFEPGLFSLYLV